MSGGFEWSGYASQPLSGVPEALDAAGIDCVIPERDDHAFMDQLDSLDQDLSPESGRPVRR